MSIGVTVGVASAISFVTRIGSGNGNFGPRGATNDTLEEPDEEDEGGAVDEGLKEEVDDEPGRNKESPESFCIGGRVSIDDSNSEPPSDSVDEPGISCRKDEFKL